MFWILILYSRRIFNSVDKIAKKRFVGFHVNQPNNEFYLLS
jgi:hypothetical protein